MNKNNEPPKKGQNKQEAEDKNTPSYGWGEFICLVLAVVAYVGLSAWNQEKHPKLAAFGVRDWATECQGQGRHYLMRSSNPHDHHQGASFDNRNLMFLPPKAANLDAEALYSTSYFVKESLDEKAVWRFKKKKDTRLLASKNESAVLQGDEAWFEISENFEQLKIITTGGQKLSLNCQKRSL